MSVVIRYHKDIFKKYISIDYWSIGYGCEHWKCYGELLIFISKCLEYLFIYLFMCHCFVFMYLPCTRSVLKVHPGLKVMGHNFYKGGKCVARRTRGSIFLTFGSSCNCIVFGVSEHLEVDAQMSYFEYHTWSWGLVLLVFVMMCTVWDFPAILGISRHFLYFGGKQQQASHVT